MAELTYKSAGVGVREIDLSSPSRVSPTGTPAGVIGTSERGPAYVPTVTANYKEFTSKFGNSNSGRMGPIAMYQWLKNAGSGLYIRVLGAGDSKKRVLDGVNAGRVNNAGFVVGSKQIQDSGDLGANPYAYNNAGSKPGRTHFLGCFMSASDGSTMFSEAGLQPDSTAVPILRGVVLTPSGVLLTLSSSQYANNVLPLNAVPNKQYGLLSGTIDTSNAKQEFVMFLSGHISTVSYPNTITASFDPAAPNYFGNIFNTDLTKTEIAGHCLAASWDVYPSFAIPSGDGVPEMLETGHENNLAFILTGALGHNSGSVTIPNFEGFEDRFTTAASPWVISQKFGGERENLFKVHALDDGAWPNERVKISIRGLTPSSDPTSDYGTFDLYVRDFRDSDDNQVVLETFIGLSLDPSSPKYIARAIGDTHVYYDFDREAGSQKLVVDGLYPNNSNYIRVEVAPSVENAEVPATSLPFGFRGYYHLNTEGMLHRAGIASLDNVKQLPLPLRKTISQGTGTSTRVTSYLHWGVQYEAVDSLTEQNKNNWSNNNVVSYSKYFAKYHTNFANPWIGDSVDADAFANNLFSIDQIQVKTSSVTGLPDPNQWAVATYSRDSVLDDTHDRFLQTSDLADLGSRKYIKFTFNLQGGFDGVNSLDANKSKLNNLAALREMVYSSTQGGAAGATVASYRKAIDVVAERADVDVQLLAIPGIREPGVTDYALDAVENRFDALYIMDVEERNTDGLVITGSSDTPSVTFTATSFKDRQLDSSFGAAYYPDVIIIDPTTGIEVIAPPSVAALGAFSLNDRVAYPWFAPAGFTRGALGDVTETQTKLNRDNMDTLYSANINPIATIPGSPSPIINGQKTLLNRTSALDRVNVRRLLIEIRRRVRVASNQILFEPNREETLARFSNLVDPILKQIQAQSGVDRYLVKIDTTTTTQADVENNTIRGKIFVQPTKSIEFVSLDFVVTNAGATI